MEHRPPSPSAPPRRLLIPIDAREESRASIRHALHRAAAGEDIEVFLVFVLPPANHADMLRFRAEQQDAALLQRRADLVLAEAALRLMAAGVPCRQFVRDAEPVQGIRDFAEEWACSEVVLPNAWRSEPFTGAQRRRLRQLEGVLRVTWIDSDGSPEPAANDGEF